jgi:DNA modification methylase
MPLYFIDNFTDSNSLILDLFAGTGTTLIACEQTNRQCYMMEIDPHYCSVIIERWESLTGKKHKKIKEGKPDGETE